MVVRVGTFINKYMFVKDCHRFQTILCSVCDTGFIPLGACAVPVFVVCFELSAGLFHTALQCLLGVYVVVVTFGIFFEMEGPVFVSYQGQTEFTLFLQVGT